MKPNPRAEAERWLAQARSDLAFAQHGLDGGFHAQACFMCQQAGEKALKALHYLGGARFVTSHSLVRLLGAVTGQHPELSDLGEAARQLDLYYVSTRYPNALPDDIPANVFSRAQARDAVMLARRIVDTVGERIG